MTGHRVNRFARDVQHPPQPFPRDAWQGETFVEADGTELEVVAMPIREWPPKSGTGDYRTIGRRHGITND